MAQPMSGSECCPSNGPPLISSMWPLVIRQDWASAQPRGTRVLRGQEKLHCRLRPNLQGTQCHLFHVLFIKASHRFKCMEKQTPRLVGQSNKNTFAKKCGPRVTGIVEGSLLSLVDLRS